MADQNQQKNDDSSDVPVLHGDAPVADKSPTHEEITLFGSKQTEASVFAPGTLIDSYRVISLIGKGGMGAVYKVEQVFLKKEFALKTFGGTFNEHQARRFQTEAKATSKLDHPNIVRVSDFGLIDNSTPYFVMELVEGISLEEHLRRNGPLSYEEIFAVFIPLCMGLHDAHEMGIVHRDVKPSNIMLVGKQGNWQPKLLDFGIAKLTDEKTALTQTGEIVGSPLYMSPEQCSAGKVDRRSDIYSLGCTMFEAITGGPPFTGASAIETIGMHLNKEPQTLKEATMGQEFPADLERIVHSMLAKKPDQRFASARQVAGNLIRLKQGEQLMISSHDEKLFEQNRTGPTLTNYILGTIAVIATGFAFYFWMLLQDERRAGNVPDLASTTDGIRGDRSSIISEKGLYGSPLSGSEPETSKPFCTKIRNENGREIRVFDFPQKSVGLLKNRQLDLAYEAKGHVEIPWRGPLVFKPTREVVSAFPGLFDKFKDDEILSIIFDRETECHYDMLMHLRSYKFLEELSFNDSDFNDAGIIYLDPLPHLRSLSVITTDVTADGLAKYKRLKKLGKLCLGQMPKMTNLINALQGGELDTLKLRFCIMTEQDFAKLAKLPKLARIEIDTSELGPDAFNGLCKSKSLEWMDLQHCFLRPETYPALAKMKHLKTLILTGHKFSAEDRKSIVELVPNCQVIFK
ncbi:MAG: serine/threonine protein kinase [Candidatus Obscuribacterales bacterium]|nr:serine/threonine protein kinase [Candidatus Obscuribacterales bacterium]